jgi:cobalamin biosynthesis Co2+ chelatase CbiK
MKVGKGKIWTPFDNLVIIELKSEKSTPACTLNMIKSKGFNPCGISKYYIGMVTLYPELKQTTSKYKPTFLEIKKISKKI